MTTALIPLHPTGRTPPGHGRGRPRSDFLAQLIATAQQAPQTRARRRAEPEEAIAAYVAGDRLPRRAGHTLARSL